VVSQECTTVGVGSGVAWDVSHGPSIFYLQVNVQILTGRLITLSVSPDDTVEEVHEKIRMKEGINPDQQRLLFKGQKMLEDATIDDYLIQEYATLFLTLRNRGG
jgi:hypothetical protein